MIGDDGVGLMVVDDGICAFCAKSRVIRAIFSFVLVTTVVVTIATPVLSVKDFVSALASYGGIVFLGRVAFYGRPRAVLMVVGCVILTQTFVSLALRESSAKLGRSESGSESAHHSAGSARVRGNDAGQIDAPRNRERIMRMDVAKNRASNNVSFLSGKAIPDDSSRKLKTIQPSGTLVQELALAASDKNQVMDELLNQPDISSDYGETMVSLYRDRGQDVLTRDFAVQHIGLYAQALQRRGVYDPASADSRSLRAALFDAAAETRTIVAAAAFRAPADMAACDPHIDSRRLDVWLATCAGDASAAPAARVMAVHLCGERRVKSAIPALEKICAAPGTSEILRRSAGCALSRIR